MSTPLTSWKEIAQHLNKSVRTVQRWEREFGLPVRRPEKDGYASVLAFSDELDLWLHEHTVAHQLQDLRAQVQALSSPTEIAGRLSRLQHHYEKSRHVRERAEALVRQTETLLSGVQRELVRLQSAVQESRKLKDELRAIRRRAAGNHGAAKATPIAS